MTTDVKKWLIVEIDRKTWLHGEGSDPSRLLRERDDKMCCLGSVCLAAGIVRSAILGVSSPAQRSESLETSMGIRRFPVLPTGLISPLFDTHPFPEQLKHQVFALMAINDLKVGQYSGDANIKPVVSDEDRELRIMALMAELGIRATFVGEY